MVLPMKVAVALSGIPLLESSLLAGMNVLGHQLAGSALLLPHIGGDVVTVFRVE